MGTCTSPRNYVILGEKSLNRYLMYITDLILKRGEKEIVIVASGNRIRRALDLFEILTKELKLQPTRGYIRFEKKPNGWIPLLSITMKKTKKL
jgi:hypothetical protein